jgi:hypothetical protein
MSRITTSSLSSLPTPSSSTSTPSTSSIDSSDTLSDSPSSLAKKPKSSLSKTSSKAVDSSSSSTSSSSKDSDTSKDLVNQIKGLVVSEVGPLIADQIKAALSSLNQASQATSSSNTSSLLSSIRSHLSDDKPKVKAKAKSSSKRPSTPSSDSSSSSDSDDDDNHDEQSKIHTSSPASDSSLKSAVLSSLSIDDRLSSSVLAQMSVHGSFLKWFDKINWRNQRNRRECHFLCTVLDVLLEEGEVNEDSLALELLVRRLNGIHLADSTGNWEACSALQGAGPDHSLLSRDIVFKAIKQASKIDKLSGKTKSSSSSARSSYESGSL